MTAASDFLRRLLLLPLWVHQLLKNYPSPSRSFGFSFLFGRIIRQKRNRQIENSEEVTLKSLLG